MFNLVFNNNILILPFGVLIYTMYRKEAEDKVIEEYKKLRAIK